MKRFTFIISFIIIVSGLSAQKQVRSEIRSGNNAYKEQRYETAQEHYQKAIEGNASSKEASFNLSNAFYKQQRWDDALKEYQHYLTIETEKPGNMSAAWNNMGNTFLKKKASGKGQQQAVLPDQGQQGGQQQHPDDLQMSMEAYKNALRLNPKDNEARYNLAVVQKMIQDQQQGGGGGQDDKKDQKDDKKEDKQDKQDQKKDDQKKDDQKQDKQEQQQQDQMSQENIEQILNAIEQDERDTQDRVQKQKAEERKQKNQDNRRQNKDW